MDSNKSTSRFLEVDGMTGDACVQKVSVALKGLRNVSTQSVKVGSVHLNTDEEGCKNACAAITSAGYKAREQSNSGVKGSSPTVVEHKGGQPGMNTANDKQASNESERLQANTPAATTTTT